MWSTTQGLRILRGREADLVRRAVTEMLSLLEEEVDSEQTPRTYGVTWFDQWDVEQRIWLLEVVTSSLFLKTQDPPPSAAIFEATVDAIFCHVTDEVESEIESVVDVLQVRSWRQGLLDAFASQNGRSPGVSVDQIEMRDWRRVACQVSDAILGHPSYQQAETFRDGDARHADRFLLQRGLPTDYLQRIPPLRRHAETLTSIDLIKQTVGR